MQKITLKIGLETDGDYSLKNALLYNMKYDDCGSYFNNFVFTCDTPQYAFEDEHDIDMSPSWRACRLLEKMICDIHVSYTHHYIIPYIYKMFEDSIEAVGRNEAGFESSISGNYEGTFIEVYCEEV